MDKYLVKLDVSAAGVGQGGGGDVMRQSWHSGAMDHRDDSAPHVQPAIPADPVRALFYAVVCALALGSPFALKLGAEFFLPLTAAVVIAIALVPALEWLERRGVPSALAAIACVLSFLLVLNGALAIIILPASGWFIRLPESLPRIRSNLTPLIDFYANLQMFVDDILQKFASGTAAQAQAMAVQTPDSLLGFVAEAAPAAAIQTFFAVLLIFFFLAGWTNLRRTMIGSRSSFHGAKTTSQIIQNVVSATSAYLSTIVAINASLGIATTLFLWMLGMPSPWMWGGIVTLCNFVPYVGPIIAAALLAMGGLMTFDSVALALLPAAIQIGLHFIEANIVTPLILGRRLTINPVLILVSLSFWGWIWGAPGAFLAVPILIIIQTIYQTFSQSAAAEPHLPPQLPSVVTLSAQTTDAAPDSMKQGNAPHPQQNFARDALDG